MTAVCDIEVICGKNRLVLQVDDCCFSDLTIISDAILRYLTPKGFATLTEEAQYNVKKRQLLKVHSYSIVTIVVKACPTVLSCLTTLCSVLIFFSVCAISRPGKI